MRQASTDTFSLRGTQILVMTLSLSWIDDGVIIEG